MRLARLPALSLFLLWLCGATALPPVQPLPAASTIHGVESKVAPSALKAIDEVAWTRSVIAQLQQQTWNAERDCPRFCTHTCECVVRHSACDVACTKCLVDAVPCGAQALQRPLLQHEASRQTAVDTAAVASLSSPQSTLAQSRSPQAATPAIAVAAAATPQSPAAASVAAVGPSPTAAATAATASAAAQPKPQPQAELLEVGATMTPSRTHSHEHEQRDSATTDVDQQEQEQHEADEEEEAQDDQEEEQEEEQDGASIPPAVMLQTGAQAQPDPRMAPMAMPMAMAPLWPGTGPQQSFMPSAPAPQMMNYGLPAYAQPVQSVMSAPSLLQLQAAQQVNGAVGLQALLQQMSQMQQMNQLQQMSQNQFGVGQMAQMQQQQMQQQQQQAAVAQQRVRQRAHTHGKAAHRHHLSRAVTHAHKRAAPSHPLPAESHVTAIVPEPQSKAVPADTVPRAQGASLVETTSTSVAQPPRPAAPAEATHAANNAAQPSAGQLRQQLQTLMRMKQVLQNMEGSKAAAGVGGMAAQRSDIRVQPRAAAAGANGAPNSNPQQVLARIRQDQQLSLMGFQPQQAPSMGVVSKMQQLAKQQDMQFREMLKTDADLEEQSKLLMSQPIPSPQNVAQLARERLAQAAQQNAAPAPAPLPRFAQAKQVPTDGSGVPDYQLSSLMASSSSSSSSSMMGSNASTSISSQSPSASQPAPAGALQMKSLLDEVNRMRAETLRAAEQAQQAASAATQAAQAIYSAAGPAQAAMAARAAPAPPAPSSPGMPSPPNAPSQPMSSPASDVRVTPITNPSPTASAPSSPSATLSSLLPSAAASAGSPQDADRIARILSLQEELMRVLRRCVAGSCSRRAGDDSRPDGDVGGNGADPSSGGGPTVVTLQPLVADDFTRRLHDSLGTSRAFGLQTDPRTDAAYSDLRAPIACGPKGCRALSDDGSAGAPLVPRDARVLNRLIANLQRLVAWVKEQKATHGDRYGAAVHINAIIEQAVLLTKRTLALPDARDSV